MQLQQLQKLLQTPMPIPKLQPNERILFIGNMNSLYGDMFSHGFINVLRQELAGSTFKDVTIMQLLLPDDGKNHQALYENGLSPQRESNPLDDEDDSLTSLLTEVYAPTKIVYLIGHEVIESDEALQHLDTTLRHIEYSCAHLAHNLDTSMTIPIILAPLFLHGEQHDQANRYDEHFEILQGKLHTLAKHHQFAYLDLTAILMKVLECWNVENQPSGVLTYDGKVFNARGHAVLAQAFLHAWGIVLSPTSLLQTTYGFIWETEECPVIAVEQGIRQARRKLQQQQVPRRTNKSSADEGDQEEVGRRLIVEAARSRSMTMKESLKRFHAL